MKTLLLLVGFFVLTVLCWPLALLAVLFTCWAARDLLVPIMLAMFFALAMISALTASSLAIREARLGTVMAAILLGA